MLPRIAPVVGIPMAPIISVLDVTTCNMTIKIQMRRRIIRIAGVTMAPTFCELPEV